MSGFKNIMKDGWQPKGKQGGKESWRGDFKGIDQLAGWMGKGRDPNEEKSEHVSQPLSTLRDPASFGPPPKHASYHGGAAPSDRITPDIRGSGTPLSRDHTQDSYQSHRGSEEEYQSSKPAPPPAPYRADTTGLRTDHLPPPPVHRAIAGVSPQSTGGYQSAKPKPSLPPRLPPRTPSNFAEPSSPPPAYEPVQSPSPISLPPAVSPPPRSTSNSSNYLNHGAVNRLGKAGVNVPGLGIGESNPWKSEQSTSATSANTGGAQLNELQARFARMNSNGAPAEPSPAPSQGTTWAEKQAAMKTTQDFHKNPSSVSMQDVRQTASTAKNFGERHGKQIKSQATDLNKKYNVTGRMNSFIQNQSSPSTQHAPSPPYVAPPTSASTRSPLPPPTASYSGGPPLESPSLSQRKAPPPPPPKKPANMSTHPINGAQSPPPVPMGTKPR